MGVVIDNAIKQVEDATKVMDMNRLKALYNNKDTDLADFINECREVFKDKE